MENLISAADLTAYAPDLDTSQFNAITLSGIISRASAMVIDYCQVKGFVQAQETAEQDKAPISPNGDLIIDVRRRPIVSISAVSLVKGGFSTSLILVDGNNLPLYQTPYPGNRFYFPNRYLAATGSLMRGGSSNLISLKSAEVFYSITYVGGYNSIPDAIKQAATLYVRHILRDRYNQTGATSMRQGATAVSFTQKSTFQMEAESILNHGNYVRDVL